MWKHGFAFSWVMAKKELFSASPESSTSLKEFILPFKVDSYMPWFRLHRLGLSPVFFILLSIVFMYLLPFST